MKVTCQPRSEVDIWHLSQVLFTVLHHPYMTFLKLLHVALKYLLASHNITVLPITLTSLVFVRLYCKWWLSFHFVTFFQLFYFWLTMLLLCISAAYYSIGETYKIPYSTSSTWAAVTYNYIKSNSSFQKELHNIVALSWVCTLIPQSPSAPHLFHLYSTNELKGHPSWVSWNLLWYLILCPQGVVFFFLLRISL